MIPRRHTLAALGGMALAPIARAQTPREGADEALRALLQARTSRQGRALVAARVAPEHPPRQAWAARRDSALAGGLQARFEFGSITKTFTALLLAEASLRRELQLDDPVESLLPAGQRLRDSAGVPIRLVDLATHRSGMPRLPENLNPAAPDDPYADYDEAALEAWITTWRATQPRDTAWSYSNLGYGLLGHVLARRAGQPYARVLDERVLAPLGLGGASGIRVATPDDTMPPTPGHDGDGRPVRRWTFRAMAGAGALTGTVAHLQAYAEAAVGLRDTPLRAAFDLCLTRRAEGPAPINPIGLGWILAPLNGRTLAQHDGGTAGHATSLWLDPSRRAAAMVLSDAAVPVSRVALHVLDAAVPMDDAPPPDRPTVPLSAEQLAPLAGVYALNPAFKLTVTLRGTQLVAQATGQGTFELFASAPRRFFARVAAIEVLFEGESGQPPALQLQQNGGSTRWLREP